MINSREFFESIEQEKQWRETLDRNREGLKNSAVFLQLWSDGIAQDPLACLQLGLCMMMDKPIHIAVPHGSKLPSNMQKVAASIEYYDRPNPKDIVRATEVILQKNAGLA